MVGISIRDAKSLCFLYILILLSSMESSTLIAKASSNNNNDKQLRCISTLADQQSNSVGSESSHICDNDNICIRYDFLGSSIAGCFPKVKDGLDTCQFVKSFGSNVCCCDTDNCNNANCFKEDKAVIIQPLRELQTTSTSVCTSSPPGKGYVEPCQFPFTYVDTTTGKRITYTSCASTNEAPPFQVIKKGVSNAMWCPSAIALNEKGEYSMQDEARRDKWGVCNCMTNTNHQCTVGEYKSRFGPLKSGKCSFPFKVLDKDNKSVWIHTCVPMNVIRPFASEAFNVANLDGASWCPTDTGVSSDGVYDKQNPDTNQNWGLCSQCVETTDPGTPRVTAAPVSLPPTPPTASPQFDLQNAVAGYEYEYGGTPSPTKRPTTRAPGATPAPSNRPTTKAPGSTPAPTTLSPTNRPTTASPTNRPTTKAPGTTPTAPTTANPTTTSPTKRPTTKAPTKKPGTETDAPTIAPSLAPTLIPTLAPNSLPTSSPAITEMDVYVHADMSRSISMANPVCMKDTGSKCWDLEVDFARDLQARLAAQLGGYYDPNSGSSKGLRFWLSTFTCIKGKAITNVLTQLTGSQTEIDAALAQMAALKPYLGTCPTQGLGYVLDSIKAHFNDPGRTNRAVIIVTDGRFDDPDSRTASPVTKQMINWGAEVFAVAVGKEIDRKQLQGVTHDASGSRIVSIDSFSSLAASGDRVAKYAVKLFRKPTVGQPTVLAQRPPSVYPTKPDGTSSEGQGNDGDSDADYINGGKSQGAAGKTNSVVIGSVIGFVAVGAAVGFFVRRRRLSRSNSSGNRHNNNGGNQVGTNIQITSHLESKPVVSASAQHVQKPSPAPSTSKALSTGVRPGTRPVAQESPVASPVSFKGLSNTPPVGQSLPGRKALASTTATKKSAAKSTSASQAKGSSSVYQSKLADPRTWASSSAATKPTNQKPSSSTPSI